MLIGTKGALLHHHAHGPMLLPDEKIVKGPFEYLDHYHQFVDACLGLTKSASFFAKTGPMTEAILLGTVAIRTPGQKLEWNHHRMKITNNKDANRHLKRTYRDGWHLGGF